MMNGPILLRKGQEIELKGELLPRMTSGGEEKEKERGEREGREREYE